MQPCSNQYGYNISHFPGDEKVIQDILSYDNPRVLEIGPGDGSFLKRLLLAARTQNASITVMICELSDEHKRLIQEMFDRAAFPKKIKLLKSRSRDVREFFAVQDRSHHFTAVVARNSLHFLPPHNLVWVLDQLYASLVPEGMAHVTMSPPGMLGNVEALAHQFFPGRTHQQIRDDFFVKTGMDIDCPPYTQMNEELRKSNLWTSFQKLEEGGHNTEGLRNSLAKKAMSQKDHIITEADIEGLAMQKFTAEHCSDMFNAWGFVRVNFMWPEVTFKIADDQFNWENPSRLTIGTAYKPTKAEEKARDPKNKNEVARILRQELYRSKAGVVWTNVQRNFPMNSVPIPSSWSKSPEQWKNEAEARK